MDFLPSSFTERRIALLIDGDNVPPANIKYIIPELSRHGIVVSRRVYGDFSKLSADWRDVCLEFAMRPMHQYRNSGLKNTTDVALVIDAMDILANMDVNAFCIASNDSDFTGLVMTLREKGRYVIGLGTQQAARALRAACNLYIYIENLIEQNRLVAEMPPSPVQTTLTPNPLIENGAYPLALVMQAFNNCVDDSGWVDLSTLGNQLRAIDSAFDSRTYGYNQLSKLLRARPNVFRLSDQDEDRLPNSALYVRLAQRQE